jgi:hypothetical protein
MLDRGEWDVLPPRQNMVGIKDGANARAVRGDEPFAGFAKLAAIARSPAAGYGASSTAEVTDPSLNTRFRLARTGQPVVLAKPRDSPRLSDWGCEEFFDVAVEQAVAQVPAHPPR